MNKTKAPAKLGIPTGMHDKVGQPIHMADRVQVVNGTHSGKTLTNVRVCPKPFHIEGDLESTSAEKVSVVISPKKVRRLP